MLPLRRKTVDRALVLAASLPAVPAGPDAPCSPRRHLPRNATRRRRFRDSGVGSGIWVSVPPRILSRHLTGTMWGRSIQSCW